MTNNKQYPVEGRPLGRKDVFFCEKGFALKAITSYVNPTLQRNPGKFPAALQQLAKSVPLLRAHVVPGKEGLMFSLQGHPKGPQLKIHSLENDIDDENEETGVLAVARQLAQQELANYAQDEQATRQVSLCLHVILGKRRIAYAAIAPHHFMDGVGLGAALICFVLLVHLPRTLWWIVTRQLSPSCPTLAEMAMKDDLAKIRLTKYQSNRFSTRRDPRNFRFAEYDLAAPGASSLLRGLQADLAQVNHTTMEASRTRLREANITLSSALGALSIQVLARLLQEFQLNPDSCPLLGTCGVDARGLGTWPKKNKLMSKRIPVIGNYAFAMPYQVPWEEALHGRLVDISLRVRNETQRLRNDPGYRATKLSTVSSPTNNLYCGVSSLVVPTLLVQKRLGFRDMKMDGKIDFGPVPHVWFYCLTLSRVATTIMVDVQLPIEGLSQKQVQSAIARSVSGSPLEPLFSLSWQG